MSLPFLQYHPNIKINITDNRHFALAYLLGKLKNSLHGQRHKNDLNIPHFRRSQNITLENLVLLRFSAKIHFIILKIKCTIIFSRKQD